MIGRSMPADFKERAPTMSLDQIRREWRIGYKRARQWLAMAGHPREAQHRRGMPEGFAAVAESWTSARLQRHFQITEYLVLQFRKQLGISVRHRGTAIEIPEGFAAAALSVPAPLLAERYGISTSLARKWRFRLGIRPNFKRQYRRDGSTKVRAPAARSTIDMAARHLGRICPTYRCRENGQADPTGDFWRYGRVVLTPDEMIERAKRHGYEPDAWRKLAA